MKNQTDSDNVTDLINKGWSVIADTKDYVTLEKPKKFKIG